MPGLFHDHGSLEQSGEGGRGGRRSAGPLFRCLPSGAPPAGPEDAPRVILFLDNLWEFSGEKEETFRRECAITYLHELGHYLGWDEDEVTARGLE